MSAAAWVWLCGGLPVGLLAALLFARNEPTDTPNGAIGGLFFACWMFAPSCCWRCAW